ncbi:MAG TPA: hypothetical protein PLV25_00270, partial [Opitutales bacterium]|nr:hypothetical protein [Opitutales bacterium]
MNAGNVNATGGSTGSPQAATHTFGADGRSLTTETTTSSSAGATAATTPRFDISKFFKSIRDSVVSAFTPSQSPQDSRKSF